MSNHGERGAGRGAASSYATGGGGTVLEHTFGATLLAALLTGDPVSALGDEQRPVSVSFQAGNWSPVDDLVVIGEPDRLPDGEVRQLSIGVRRKPRIARSDQSF